MEGERDIEAEGCHTQSSTTLSTQFYTTSDSDSNQVSGCPDLSSESCHSDGDIARSVAL